MKKKLLWVLPTVLLLAFLVGLGIWMDRTAPEVPAAELIPSQPQQQEPVIPTETSEITEELSSETEPEESKLPTVTEPSETTEPSRQEESPTWVTEPSITEPDADLAAKEARIEELVAEVYALRDYYTAQLQALEASAKAQYEALSLEERTPQQKQDIALSCVDAAYALENECDARMDAVCQELSYLLLETGGSMSLITDIRYAYASEKETVRTAFLQKYANYFG